MADGLAWMALVFRYTCRRSGLFISFLLFFFFFLPNHQLRSVSIYSHNSHYMTILIVSRHSDRPVRCKGTEHRNHAAHACRYILLDY